MAALLMVFLPVVFCPLNPVEILPHCCKVLPKLNKSLTKKGKKMSTDNNRQWRLKERPQGMVAPSNFEYSEQAIPEPGEGEVLVQNLYLSFDPTFRGQMVDRPSYVAPMQLGEVMRGGSGGRVVASNNARFQVGDLVSGAGGWQDYFVAGSNDVLSLSKLAEGVSIPNALSIFGITGLTAYFGLLDIGQPKAGDTVLVSGAAGATGSVVGQIAKLKGCRVIGIAGGQEKCNWLKREAGFDETIDYKSENVYQRIRQLCPAGVNVHFENVGGEILEAALGSLAMNARVVLCGGISSYNSEQAPPGPNSLMNLVITRSRIEGFIVLDYAEQFPRAVKELAQWMSEGKLVSQEDIQQGLENAPQTFMRLFNGKNRGKQILKL
ncbi:MAG: NADPH-dependent curcumin reductase CurA [Paraglaciecola psychrophila]|jgi:NADPH-dependent curcumin reductase CurA